MRNSLDYILAEVDGSAETGPKKMVPFPEFGVDIVVVHHKNGKKLFLKSVLSITFILFPEMDFSTSSSSSSSSLSDEEIKCKPICWTKTWMKHGP